MYKLTPTLQNFLEVSSPEIEAHDLYASLNMRCEQGVLSEPFTPEIIINDLLSLEAYKAALLVGRTFFASFSSVDTALRMNGITAMLAGEESYAQECFLDLLNQNPDDPSVYCNLAQLQASAENWDAALEWIQAGLALSAQHRPLWMTFATVINQSHGVLHDEQILDLAKKYKSWVGISLYVYLKELAVIDHTNLLSELYEQGVKEHEFLVEYTGLLGEASDYKKIAEVVWVARTLTTEALPWQLLFHGLQAEAALENKNSALDFIKELRLRKDLPKEMEHPIKEIASSFES